MRRILSLFSIFLIGILPRTVLAFELNCNSNTYHYNDSFTCNLVGDINNYEVISGSIENNGIIACNRVNIASGLLVGTSSTESYFELSGTPAFKELITFTCSVSREVESLTNLQISVNDFSYKVFNNTGANKNEVIKSDFIQVAPTEKIVEVDPRPRDTSDPDIRLKSLSSPELNFTFSQFITTYSIEVLHEVEKVELDYSLNNINSSVRIEGNTNLQVGSNDIDIYVTNPDGTKINCYTLNITRLARGEEIYYPEKDATLESLTIKGFSIGFDKGKTEYSIHLTSDVDSVIVNAKPTYENAIVSISETDNLKNGSIIKITVTSADESVIQEYRIKVTKDAPKKDYTTIIVIVLLSLAFVGAIAMFIMTSQKKKLTDPLLRLKKDKRKINRGANFDSSVVPDTDNNQNIESNREEITETLPEEVSNSVAQVDNINTVVNKQTTEQIQDSSNQEIINQTTITNENNNNQNNIQ
ncbi:MAG: cadherin-like beta sandwich domain-containing protein [Erysipelotrichales bacterium]|nr:cadherin-like beta sandwich domain-containing protein [Erysipelotrichales bacterium]